MLNYIIKYIAKVIGTELWQVLTSLEFNIYHIVGRVVYFINWAYTTWV